MRRNSFLTFLKEKSFIIVLALMLISAGTMAALFSLDGDAPAEENQVAQQEEITPEAEPTETIDTKEEYKKMSKETEGLEKAKSIPGVPILKQSETAVIYREPAAQTIWQATGSIRHKKQAGATRSLQQEKQSPDCRSRHRKHADAKHKKSGRSHAGPLSLFPCSSSTEKTDHLIRVAMIAF